MVTDKIRLETPVGRDWGAVIRLVLGGIGDRLDLGIDELDDLQLAVERLLAEAGTQQSVTLSFELRDGRVRTHVGPLAERMAAGDYHAGFAFDGDGDRVLGVDRRGQVVDGDELIATCALHLRRQGRLWGDGVVVTVMTNYGFHQAMDAAGVRVATTPVGDRHVLGELLARGWALGGEQSGHIIDTAFVPSGDGIAAALLTLEALAGDELAGREAMVKLPQQLLNVKVADSSGLQSATAVWDAVERESTELEGRGRVLVRPSGTEPVVRVMVEAPEAAECEAVARRLAGVVERSLG